MNRILYYDIVKWLGERRVREDADEWMRNYLITTGRQFEQQNSKLYRKENDALIPVIREEKVREIIRLVHDHHLSGYMGQRNIYYQLLGHAWWPGMQDDIIQYVQQCDKCQK